MHVVWLTVITFGSYSVIIWCNIRVYRHMKRFTVANNARVKEIHFQLNRVLTVQAVVPIFTVVLPLSLLVIALYIDSFSIGAATSCASLGLSWIPVGNSASVLFFVKSYRRRLISTLLCRFKRNSGNNSSVKQATSEFTRKSIVISGVKIANA